MNSDLLTIHQLSIKAPDSTFPLIDNLNLSLQPKQTLAIVGESGSGKSLLAKAMMGLLPKNLQAQGQIYFKNQQISSSSLRKPVGMSLIVQNAMSAFDPLMSLEKQCIESLALRKIFAKHTALSKRDYLQQLALACEQVKLSPDILKRYPNQLSGGQLQRVMLALTLAMDTELIIADEPTTALDAITQFEILPLFKQLVEQKGCSLIFITHDLGLVKELADQIAVLKTGRLVELQAARQLFNQPQHSYTQYLLSMREKLNRALHSMKGESYV
ncbi:ABC transporter ATP-binding protein [Mannheimia massilioguelmaensis]|uniref:ATP-binding cassette domain-containing protein n=1 Tax=Mannheimia massilioguelmaensis TaxID=1604354 RepID=UPI0005C93F14|nr:ABC transporter ATP-binding protein [Mannheimia massilioguelmaensis]